MISTRREIVASFLVSFFIVPPFCTWRVMIPKARWGSDPEAARGVRAQKPKERTDWPSARGAPPRAVKGAGGPARPAKRGLEPEAALRRQGRSARGRALSEGALDFAPALPLPAAVQAGVVDFSRFELAGIPMAPLSWFPGISPGLSWRGSRRSPRGRFSWCPLFSRLEVGGFRSSGRSSGFPRISGKLPPEKVLACLRSVCVGVCRWPVVSPVFSPPRGRCPGPAGASVRCSGSLRAPGEFCRGSFGWEKAKARTCVLAFDDRCRAATLPKFGLDFGVHRSLF